MLPILLASTSNASISALTKRNPSSTLNNFPLIWNFSTKSKYSYHSHFLVLQHKPRLPPSMYLDPCSHHTFQYSMWLYLFFVMLKKNKYLFKYFRVNMTGFWEPYSAALVIFLQDQSLLSCLPFKRCRNFA